MGSVGYCIGIGVHNSTSSSLIYCCGQNSSHRPQTTELDDYFVFDEQKTLCGTGSAAVRLQVFVLLLCTSKMTQAQNSSSIAIGVELIPGGRGGERGSTPEAHKT